MEEEKNILTNNTPMETKKKNNSVLVILLVLIILALVGYIVYTQFLNKDDNDKPKDNNVEEQGKTNYLSVDNLAGLTFKTKDGKNVLKIVSTTDSKALERAKELKVDDRIENFVDYLGYYNDTLFFIFKKGENTDTYENSKYIVLGGEEEGQIPQCRDTNNFVINASNNTLVDIQGQNILLHKVGDKYYFTTGSCAMAFNSEKVYDENTKLIGEYFINYDANGNIFVLNGEYITKYDKNGNIVSNSSQKYNEDDINEESIVYKDTLYIIAKIDRKIYLKDAMTDEKYQLDGIENYFSPEGWDAEYIRMKNNNNIIEISHYEYDDAGEHNIISYTFNPETKELIKK